MKVLFLVLFAFIYAADAAKILGIFHMSAYSHYILGSTLLKALVAKGHNVTVISSFDQKPPLENYRVLLVPELQELAKTLPFMEMRTYSVAKRIKFLNEASYTMTELTLNNTNVQRLINSQDEQFDLVIMELFMNEAFRGFQHHFNAPCVMFSTLKANAWTNLLTGNPGNPAYVADIFSPFTAKMSFFERLTNSLMSLTSYLTQHLYSFPLQSELLQKYFPDAPPITDLIYNTSLVLLNSQPSINNPVPLLPNMIEIGGLHIKSKPLPKDLQDYLDKATEGVVYFSLGSNLKSKDLSAEKRSGIINVFSKLKMKVLWKFEDENLVGASKNIKISNWLPQQDILAHPNVKLFITHGGFLSTTETIYYGKPILGIPFFGDQQMNMQQAQSDGYGLALDYDDLTEETFSRTLNEMLTNPKYAKNVEERSKRMQDQPMTPLDKAVYWVEYVMRQNGAYHLRSSSLDLFWYQYLLLDVIAFVAMGLLLALGAIFIVFKFLTSTLRHKAVASKKKVN